MVNMAVVGEEISVRQYHHFRRGNMVNMVILGEKISSIWSFQLRDYS